MLETIKVTKSFKGLRAINRIDLKVAAAEIVGIIGPNGAGKTTLFNLITGFLQPTSGKIVFGGKDITGRKPNAIAELGVARTFQLDRIFHDFTVLQNVMVASRLYARIGFWEAIFHTRRYRTRYADVWEYADKILQFIGLDNKKDEIASNLAHGHQKLLGIAVALAANPKLLLLDEPVAGMNREEIAVALEIIAKIRSRGISILLIDHNMSAVMSVCDRIVVLNFGTEIARGSPEEVKQNKDVIQAYLGVGKHAA
jgi:branched-chain amino acid transport system ATP-binding protein